MKLKLTKIFYDTGELSNLYYLDEHSRIQGVYKRFSKDGKIITSIGYKDNRLHGTYFITVVHLSVGAKEPFGEQKVYEMEYYKFFKDSELEGIMFHKRAD